MQNVYLLISGDHNYSRHTSIHQMKAIGITSICNKIRLCTAKSIEITEYTILSVFTFHCETIKEKYPCCSDALACIQ